jgi:hypothetical protein
MSFTWNPRLVKTPTPIMSAMTIAVAVAVDTVARFELPLLAGIIDYLPRGEPAFSLGSPLVVQMRTFQRLEVQMKLRRLNRRWI